MSRKDITTLLGKAAIGHLVKKGYGVNKELAVVAKGRRKVDIIGVNLKGNIIVIEIKSCLKDFKDDKKWQEYLPYCNQFYFLFTQVAWTQVKPIFHDIKGVGVLILCPETGYLTTVKPSRKREMDASIYQSILLRLAWRNATHSKRNSYRTKVFL